MTIQIKVVQRVLGILLAMFSVTMLTPMIVGAIYGDGVVVPFVGAFFTTAITGMLLYLPVRKDHIQLKIRDGFVVVVLFWGVLGIFGSLPFILYSELDLSIPAAIFESMSGLTTTGATLIVGLDNLPHSILFYRQQMQWLGGMGIIVLAIAILPMLGIGGMQLYRAESSGPSKDKLTPRIAGTAKALWFIYLGLTFVCALAYLAAGMSVFDAISHSFSTIAIGGFSTHDASIGHFDSAAIEMVAVFFMLVSGVNFALHFTAVRTSSLKSYLQDEEFRAYILFALTLTVIVSTYLYFTNTSGAKDSFVNALFHVVSIGTTTGFTSEEYFNLRVLLLFKQGHRELKRLLHPNATIVVKVGGSPVPNKVIDVVWGFFATYLAICVIMLLLLMAAGHDQETAFSAVVACLNNLGPGLGEVAANYASLGDFSLVVLSFAMLFGRLEIFTLLLLFTPGLWTGGKCVSFSIFRV